MKLYLRQYGENPKENINGDGQIFDVEFHEDDFWNLDSCLATIIHKSLVEFKPRFSAKNDAEYWRKYQHMTHAFKIISEEKHLQKMSDAEHQKYIQDGLNYFAELFQSLWN